MTTFLGSTKYFFEFMLTVFHIIMVIQSYMYNVLCTQINTQKAKIIP